MPERLREWLSNQPKRVAYGLVRDCDRGDVYETPHRWSRMTKDQLIDWLVEHLDEIDYPPRMRA
ncbi:hypothetical protein SEA_CAFASSO_163 [Gordonia phage Cafasso]|uniref:Uncharacterized protein n=1 Tax=Gordonia phage Cafasso TaxID=2851095 RepID=A0AAE7SMA5_9CAUD|nr:hypothetical protein SEA_CAFASSO_163 [Gordonia phage Cafasso]